MNDMAIWIFVVVFLVSLLGIGGLVGWWFAYQRLDGDMERMDQQKAALREQWDTLHRTQRINEKFWEARQALRAEAQRARGWGRGRQ